MSGKNVRLYLTAHPNTYIHAFPLSVPNLQVHTAHRAISLLRSSCTPLDRGQRAAGPDLCRQMCGGFGVKRKETPRFIKW